MVTTRVLDYNGFTGETRRAYLIAAEDGELLAQLFPYSGSDVTNQHQSLLDCFKSLYARDDRLVRQQAIEAFQLKKKGRSIREIQRSFEGRFSQYYPFEKPSPALIAYRRKAGLPIGRTY